MTILLLGDQLARDVGPLARSDEDVLMIESTAFARRYPYHPHRLVAVFSAMRHVRDDLRAAGRDVSYYQVETFREGIARHLDAVPGDDLTVMRPPGHGAVERLRTIIRAEGGHFEVVPNDLFICDRETFDQWAGDADTYRHEQFYRFLRRETGYLMAGEDPLGGEWNYDDQNRESLPADHDPPEPPQFEPDETTRDVIAWVDDTFDGSYGDPPYGGAWADPEPFRWPVTRADALAALDDFVAHRLPTFGPYQDAMARDEWSLYHSLLSPALNLGLVHPREVIERAIEAYHERDLPLNSVEGFLRQVLGWREFMRHVYRREMPALATANQLEASEPLPEFFWTGETDMACLADVIDGVRKRGYSHHIERLMILANFATSYGVNPQAFNWWFNAAYVDGAHWVTTPNVVGMGTFGTDVLSTKPYVSSSNYIDTMSDYCSGCPYYKTKTTGENACPFNALYWEFLGRNEERLRSNHRMALVYSHWDEKDAAERAAIRDRAREIRQQAERGRL